MADEEPRGGRKRARGVAPEGGRGTSADERRQLARRLCMRRQRTLVMAIAELDRLGAAVEAEAV